MRSLMEIATQRIANATTAAIGNSPIGLCDRWWKKDLVELMDKEYGAGSKKSVRWITTARRTDLAKLWEK